MAKVPVRNDSGAVLEFNNFSPSGQPLVLERGWNRIDEAVYDHVVAEMAKRNRRDSPSAYEEAGQLYVDRGTGKATSGSRSQRATSQASAYTEANLHAMTRSQLDEVADREFGITDATSFPNKGELVERVMEAQAHAAQ